jgi:hypothetical protein
LYANLSNYEIRFSVIVETNSICLIFNIRVLSFVSDLSSADSEYS